MVDELLCTLYIKSNLLRCKGTEALRRWPHQEAWVFWHSLGLCWRPSQIWLFHDLSSNPPWQES